MRTLLIDNYDSFTYNIAQSLAKVTGDVPRVVRNDEITLDEVRSLDPDCIVISPGPGAPANDRDLGLSKAVIVDPPCPVLGICLGFQAMAHLYGSEVVRSAQPWHGRGSRIFHDGKELFRGIPSPFFAIRYHSLSVPRLDADGLLATAFTEDGTVMALRHTRRPLWGVQFHPESIATEHGMTLFRNFLDLTRSRSVPDPDHRQVPPVRATPRRVRVHFERLEQAPPAELVFEGLFAHLSPSVWLDSSAAGGLARFSFLAAPGPEDTEIRYRSRSRTLELRSASGTRTVAGSIFDFLRERLGAETASSPDLPLPFCGGYIGYLGYELKGECGGQYRHDSELPDAYFLKISRFVAYDHRTGDCWVVALGDRDAAQEWIERTCRAIRGLRSGDRRAADAPVTEPRFRPEQDRDRYLESIGCALEKIRAGESYQVCLTNRLRSEFEGDPLVLYRILRRANPAPFSAYLNAGDFSVLSASPERFLRIDPEGRIESRPIKGTIRRSSDPEEDRRLVETLRGSEKDRSENLMIVDLVRNDLGRVARTGTVEVPGLMPVESYATVHHIVSTVRARLSDSCDRIDCIRAAFPGGSMTGAPKLRTMEIIDDLESSARGVYSGALGYLSLDGSVDLSIVIRTMVVAGGELVIGTGGGIVGLSDPDAEVLEAELKAQALVDSVRRYFDRAGRIAHGA